MCRNLTIDAEGHQHLLLTVGSITLCTSNITLRGVTRKSCEHTSIWRVIDIFCTQNIMVKEGGML